MLSLTFAFLQARLPDPAGNTVRLAFKYLYGRTETTCEGAVFDKAVDAFDTKGSIKDALATIAKDPTFCQ